MPDYCVGCRIGDDTRESISVVAVDERKWALRRGRW